MDIKSWAIGFIEGDGSLAIAYRIREKGGRKLYHPRLIVQIRADDPNIIPQIEKAIGIEAYVITRQPSRRYWNTKPTIQGVWSTKEAIRAVVRLIDSQPFVGKKSIEYVYWREAAQLYLSETTDYEARNKRILELKELVAQSRIYKGASNDCR